MISLSQLIISECRRNKLLLQIILWYIETIYAGVVHTFLKRIITCESDRKKIIIIVEGFFLTITS